MRYRFFKPQISLRAMFALVSLACVMCALFALWVQPHRSQVAALETVDRLSGKSRMVRSTTAV